MDERRLACRLRRGWHRTAAVCDVRPPRRALHKSGRSCLLAAAQKRHAEELRLLGYSGTVEDARVCRWSCTQSLMRRRTSEDFVDGAGGPSVAGPAPKSPIDTPGGGGISSVLSHRVMAGPACVTPCLGDAAGSAGAVAKASSDVPATATACRASDPLLTEDTVLPRAGLGAGAFATGCASWVCCTVLVASAAASAALRRAAAAATAASWRFRHASSSCSDGTDAALV